MSWLFFCDESGHDHKNTPLEVRGGIVIHSSKIWSFIQDYNKSEQICFGVKLSEYGTEIKGARLLRKDRFKWSEQEKTLTKIERHNGVRRFLSKEKVSLRIDYTAYGQASLMMADEVFRLLEKYDAKLFASCIPRGIKQKWDVEFNDFLRKDHGFLQERFFYFLEGKKESGLIIMDQTEVKNDRKFINNLENYYTKTRNGKKRSKWIVPSPIFVDSGLSPCVQAADICLNCINWGFRRGEWNFDGALRDEIHERFAGRCGKIQFSGDVFKEGKTLKSYGIIFVPDPYTARPKAR